MSGINNKLIELIATHFSIETINNLLNQGVDPFIEFQDDINYLLVQGLDPFTGDGYSYKKQNSKSISLFHAAILSGDKDMVLTVLEQYKAHGNEPFDLTQQHPSYQVESNKGESKRSMNWLHFACLFSGDEQIVDCLIKYQEKHFPHNRSIKNIINQQFFFPTVNGVIYRDIISIMFWTILPNAIMSSFDCDSIDFNNDLAFFKEWFYAKNDQQLTKTPTKNCVINIGGFISIFQYLVKNKYIDKDTILSKGKTIQQELDFIVEACSGDPVAFELTVLPNLIGLNVKDIKVLGSHDKHVKLSMNIKNIYDAHEIQIVAILDYEEYRIALNESSKINEQLTHFEQKYEEKFASQDEKINHIDIRLETAEQKIADIEDSLNKLIDQKYEEAIKSLAPYPAWSVAFEKLHERCKGYLEARKLASFQIFAMNTKKGWMRTDLALGIFTTAIEGTSVPFATIIATLALTLVNKYKDIRATKQNEAVLNLPMDPSRMATYICLPVIGQAMQKYGDNPNPNISLPKVVAKAFKSITSQIDKLHRYEFVDPMQTVAFICKPALEDLGFVYPTENKQQITHAYQAQRSNRGENNRYVVTPNGNSQAGLGATAIMDREVKAKKSSWLSCFGA